jgi:nucleotide-binding universal stress UspA family protein
MFKDILVPIDVNDERIWKKALATAVGLAERFGATLHALTVVPEFGLPAVSQYFPADFESKMREHAHDELKAILDREVPREVMRQLIIAEGSVYREIVRVAKETGCDLIVMGSHRPELKDYLLGANATKVAQHAECSIMIVRE